MREIKKCKQREGREDKINKHKYLKKMLPQLPQEEGEREGKI